MDQRLAECMPNGEFIEYVRIAFGQVSNHQWIADDMLDNLACNHAGLVNLIRPDRGIAACRCGRLYDVSQDLVRSLARIGLRIAYWRDNKTSLLVGHSALPSLRSCPGTRIRRESALNLSEQLIIALLPAGVQTLVPRGRRSALHIVAPGLHRITPEASSWWHQVAAVLVPNRKIETSDAQLAIGAVLW